MPRYILLLFFALTNVLTFADYSDRGRPSDYQEHHDGPLTYIFMGVGAFIVLAFIVFWIYDKISAHKKQISDTLGTIFVGLFIFGAMLLFGKCGETLHNSIDSKDNTEQINSPSNLVTPSTPTSTDNQPTYQYSEPKYTPTLRYRTVEYFENCYTCGGTGQVLCPRCNGTGYYRKMCSRCNGSGGHNRSRCIYCSGKGYTEDNVFGSGNQRCISCNGTGYIENSCQWCGGSGYETETCDVYAAYGNKSHKVLCSTCNGCGKIRRTRQESYYE